LIRIESWNAEHLSDAKQDAVMAAATEHSQDAIILVESWMTPARVPFQSKTAYDGWCRMDYIHHQANRRARRGN
jgi:hypothetical protein